MKVVIREFLNNAARALAERRTRAGARALSACVLVALVGTGCATKKDLKLLRDEVIVLQQRQDSTMRAMDQGYRLLLDTLRTNFMAQLDMRGETSHRFAQLEDNLNRMQQMVFDLQTLITELRNELEVDRANQPVFVPYEAPTTMAPVVSDSIVMEMLASGRQQLDEGNTMVARNVFQMILDEHQYDPLAPEAQYWLGVTYERDGMLEEAIAALREVRTRWPNALTTTPKAMLQAGRIAEDMGDLEQARELYRAITEAYPGAQDYADEARRRLRAIGGG